MKDPKPDVALALFTNWVRHQGLCCKVHHRMDKHLVRGSEDRKNVYTIRSNHKRDWDAERCF